MKTRLLSPALCALACVLAFSSTRAAVGDDQRDQVSEMLFGDIADANNPPMITQQRDTTIAEGVFSRIVLWAADPDSGQTRRLRWRLIGAVPPWASLHSQGARGILQCRPGFESADSLGSGGMGMDSITVVVTDGRISLGGLQDTMRFLLTIAQTNRAPTIDPIADGTIGAGRAFSVVITGADPDGDALHYSLGSITPTPPSGVTPSVQDSVPTSCRLTWTPGIADVGTYTLVVDTEDGQGGFDSDDFQVIVLLTDRPPVFSPIPSSVVSANRTLTLPFSASDPDGDMITFSLDSVVPIPPSGTLPVIQTGPMMWTGTLVWTPATADTGVTYAVNIRGEDEPGLSVIGTAFVQVVVNQPPSIELISDRVVPSGQTLVVGLRGADLDGDDLHFSLSSMIPPPPSGVFPSVSDSSVTTGSLTWTPQDADSGLIAIVTVRVDDGFGSFATTSFQATVLRPVGNTHARAQLSWSATDFGLTDIAPPLQEAGLYLTLPSGVTNFKGAEFDIVWSPPGNGVDCLAHGGTLFRTSSGATCTYINRGAAVSITLTDEPGRLHIAYSNTIENVSCEAGAIAEIRFVFDGEGCDPHTTVTLQSLKLLDGNIQEWVVPAESLGVSATIGGGSQGTPRRAHRGAAAQSAPRIAALRATPSPAASSVRIDYAVPTEAEVDISVYASNGRVVRTLVRERTQAGAYSATWDTRDARGAPLPRGVYYVHAVIDDTGFRERIILLR